MDTSHPAGSGRRPRGPGVTAGAALAVLTALTALLYGAPPVGASTATPAPEVEIVAQFAPGAHHVSSVAAAAMGRKARAEPGRRYVAAVPAAQAAADVARLRAQPGVRYAEIAQRVHALSSPNDPCYSSPGCPVDNPPPGQSLFAQQYLQTIGAPQAWSVSKGDGVTVAVLDTGVDANHPDLQGKIVRQTNICGTDPACADPNNYDDNGHGTHVTGILAADTNNGIGVASLGWNVKVDEYKVLDQNGNGNTADVATAIYDAVAAGDRVINMSLANYSCQQNPSDCGPDPDEQAAVEYAIEHNVVVVAAAGNGINGLPGDNGLTYPADYPGVLAVGATDANGVVAPYSQWGQAANIAAPGDEQNPDASGNGGVGIVSTWVSWATGQAVATYHLDTGTSMAAPQVAAAAALLISHDPSLTGPQVTDLLEASARPTTGGEPVNGGLLDVPAALAATARPPTSYLGYELAGANGNVYSFGAVGAYGDASKYHLAQPVVGEALLPDGLGYWLVAADGGVFAFGDAGFYGSTGGMRLAEPIVGMAATPDGKGYWLVAADGGVFAFGDAGFYGSTGGIRLAQPVVGMARTADGNGYWLVASDGGIFAFGDAPFRGSTGGIRLAKPVVGMAATPDGNGYWLVASDGGVFAFGDARFYGSTGATPLPAPVVAVAS